MKLYFTGHNCKYSVEQMLLTLFPGERPEYPETPPAPDESSAEIDAEYRTDGSLQVRTVLRRAGKHWTGNWTGPLTGDASEREGILRHGVRLSFYEAGTACLGTRPPWGALTGVRPVKLPTRAMQSGKSRAEAATQLQTVYQVSPRRTELALDCAQASLNAQASLRENEVSLYVGIPFCPTRCAYCSFVSADVGRTLKLVEPFLEALEREIQAVGAVLERTGKRVRTVYIGGGTPTTLTAPQLDRLMGVLADRIDLTACTEYTVEAGRPDTITPEKLAVLRRRGAGRVSVNPQSMDDAVLAAMGRAHRAADILRAYADVRESGIPCVNMDLIAGLPSDSPAGFRATLDQVLALHPENITVHTLALKKGARLMDGSVSRETISFPTGADVADMLEYAWDTLRQAGQVPYYLYRQKYMSGSFENVGWTRPGFEGLYNICMMEELHTILALGGGGVTKLVDGTRIQRRTNAKYPHEYLRDIEKTLADKKSIIQFYSEKTEGGKQP